MLTAVHKAVKVSTLPAVPNNKAEFFHSFKFTIVRKLKKHMIYAFENTFQHNGADKSVTEHHISAVVIIIDHGPVCTVRIGNKTYDLSSVKSLCDMKLSIACFICKLFIADSIKFLLYLKQFTSPCR